MSVGISKLMAFIDGAYLRINLRKKFGDDNINYFRLRTMLEGVGKLKYTSPQLVRTYFYEGMPDESDSVKYAAYQKYINKIKGIGTYEIRPGRVKKSEKKFSPTKTKIEYEQKRVDVFLATDLVAKGCTHQYDVAVLLAGDDDFLDAVKAVKEMGRNIHGIYFPGHISPDLLDVFDKKVPLTDGTLRGMRTG